MKFKKAVSVILMLAVVLSSFAAMGGFAVNAADTGTNLVSNGDFENTDTSAWKTTVENTFERVSSDSTFAFKGGSYVGKLTQSGSEQTWLYQSFNLPKGTYTLKFSCFTNASEHLFGVYKSDSVFNETTLVQYDSFESLNGNNYSSTTFRLNGTSSYIDNGNACRKNTYVFTVTENNATVSFAIRPSASNSGKVLYLDDVSLTKVKTELVNGDFEDGTNGWSVTEGKTAATFQTVSAVQDDKHKDINITNNAGYFVTGGIDTWLYQGVKLAAGEYTWEFHIDLYGTHNMVGAYKSKSGIGTAAALITADTFTAVKDDGTVSSAFKNDNSKYIFSGGQNNWHYTITYKFTLTAETDVYFAIRGNGGGCQYIDNMTLIKTETKLVNGTFDTDTNGWNVTPGDGASLTAEEESELTLAKGKAAKLVNNGKTAWMYQAIKLNAGTYTWEFTTEAFNNSYSFIVGVYRDSTFGKDTLIQGTVKSHAANNVWRNVDCRSENGDYMGPGGAKRYNKYIFTLEDETVVYLAVRTNANSGATLYVDNMTLTLDLKNGDANYDATVDICDMIRIKKMIANKDCNVGGDCNDDGKLDSTDLTLLRKYLLLGTWAEETETPNSINLQD